MVVKYVSREYISGECCNQQDVTVLIALDGCCLIYISRIQTNILSFWVHQIPNLYN